MNIQQKIETEQRAETLPIPRATIEMIVGYRNQALQLYAEAFDAITIADSKIKAAADVAYRSFASTRAARSPTGRVIDSERSQRSQHKETVMKIGTKVRTLYQHSETGTIIKPPKESLPLPGPDWHIIQFDVDGGRLCIHRSMFVIANDQIVHIAGDAP